MQNEITAAEQSDAQKPATTDDTRGPVRDLMVSRMEEQFRQYAGANLRIDEAEFVIVDERGGVEYRCFTETDAMSLAADRVQHVGGVHTVFKRYAAVRPPRPEVVVEK
jgi:hypothetical protein